LKLYCISVFLDPDKWNAVSRAFSSREGPWQFRESRVSDQTGDSADSLHLAIGGLRLVFLPENHFHRDRDFEIGLTCDTAVEWQEFLRRCESSGIPWESGAMAEDPSSQYALLGGKEIHGPFFFLFDDQTVDAPRDFSLRASLPAKEGKFFRDHVKPLVDEATLAGISFVESDQFALEGVDVGGLDGWTSPMPEFSDGSFQFRSTDGRGELRFLASEKPRVDQGRNE
jgi:hypothetical protein